MRRTVMLEFTQANTSPNSTDPWVATISLTRKRMLNREGLFR